MTLKLITTERSLINEKAKPLTAYITYGGESGKFRLCAFK